MADEALTDVQGPLTFEAYAAEVLAGTPGAEKKSMSLLLTCIDYRYPRRIVDAMHRLWPVVPYDQFILAGASLGASRKSWQDVLVQHVEAALKLGHQARLGGLIPNLVIDASLLTRDEDDKLEVK